MQKSSKLLSMIFMLAVMVLIITFSIGLPIYVRPFYYAHVDLLDMEEEWGLEREYIIEAYDEVLDFLTIDGREFGTGILPYSEEGKGHFEDCKVLFDLNKNAFIVSFAIIVLLLLLNLIGVIELSEPFDYRLSFYAGIGTLILFSVLAIVVALDFSRAFTVFHKIFFPGKDNWLFNPYKDPIILFMPQQFFMDCAILICASILLISFVLIKRGIKKNRAD